MTGDELVPQRSAVAATCVAVLAERRRGDGGLAIVLSLLVWQAGATAVFAPTVVTVATLVVTAGWLAAVLYYRPRRVGTLTVAGQHFAYTIPRGGRPRIHLQ